MRDLVWEERRKPGGARTIVYAGTRSATTRFGAAMLFVVSSLALLWLARRHVEEYPRWVDVVLVTFAIAGLAAAALSSPGSAHGRTEMVDGKDAIREPRHLGGRRRGRGRERRGVFGSTRMPRVVIASTPLCATAFASTSPPSARPPPRTRWCVSSSSFSRRCAHDKAYDALMKSSCSGQPVALGRTWSSELSRPGMKWSR